MAHETQTAFQIALALAKQKLVGEAPLHSTSFLTTDSPTFPTTETPSSSLNNSPNNSEQTTIEQTIAEHTEVSTETMHNALESVISESSEQKISAKDKQHVALIKEYNGKKGINKELSSKLKGNRTVAALKTSTNLRLARNTEFLSVVCDNTGIVSLLEIPYIPGKVLSYEHPLSDLGNARGLAQQGRSYLKNLDIQVLAGILITLANDYQLFHYQPSDSGAQKNAILRTVGTEVLLNSILTIEDMIHSGNSLYLPRLSLILDSDTLQNGVESRMKSWLSLVVEAIYKPDTSFYDENATPQIAKKKERRAALKANQVFETIANNKQKDFGKNVKRAANLIKDLFKAEKISLKLRMFLAELFTEYNLLNMEEAAKALLINKLSDIDSNMAQMLISIVKKDYSGCVAKSLPANDFFDEPTTPTTPTTEAPKKATVIKKTGEIVKIEILSVEVPSQEIVAEAVAQNKVLTFAEKVALAKALKAQQSGESK